MHDEGRIKLRWVKFSPDEFIAGIAARLEPVDVGVYWMICTLIYSQGGPIEDDHVHIAGLFKKTHWRVIRASIDRLILSGKVSQEGGKLWVSRCAEELQRGGKRVADAAQNGRKGGRKRSADTSQDTHKHTAGAAQDGHKRVADGSQDDHRNATDRSQDDGHSQEINDLEKGSGFSEKKLTTTNNQQLRTNNQQLATTAEPQPAAAHGAASDSWTGLGMSEPDPLKPIYTQVIQAFDRERVLAFGEGQARAYPLAEDVAHAQRFLSSGADLDLCRGVFEAVCRRHSASGKPPPSGLQYFPKPIADALAAKRFPMPAGTPTPPKKFDAVAYLAAKEAAQ